MQPEMASFFCLVFYYEKLYSTLELLTVSVANWGGAPQLNLA